MLKRGIEVDTILMAQVADGNFVNWINTVSSFSAPALMVFAIYLGMKRTWVWGHHYKELENRLDEMRLERDEYKVMLFRALSAAEEAMKNVKKEDK